MSGLNNHDDDDDDVGKRTSLCHLKYKISSICAHTMHQIETAVTEQNCMFAFSYYAE